MPKLSNRPNSQMFPWAIFASVAVLLPSTTNAQQAAAGVERRLPIYAFNISAKPLSSAISDVGAISGWRIAYTFKLPVSVRSAAISGNMTAVEAVSRLLAGTGISYRVVGRNSIVLSSNVASDTTGSTENTTVLEAITVNGEGENALGPVEGLVAHRSASSTKTSTPLIETPQSISVVTADQVTQQATQSIGETVRYTPGTRGDVFGVSTSRDHIRVRGFIPNYYQDGLILPYGTTAQGGQSEPYGMERIEVLRGPSSVLFGQNPPGGIINMVSKRPLDDAQHEVFMQAGSFNRFQAGFDTTGPVNSEKSVLYRFVGLARKSGTQVNFADDDRYFIAPSLTLKRDDATSLTILGQFQRDRAGITEQYFPASGTLFVGPYGRNLSRTNIGEPGTDSQDRDHASVGYDFAHEFDNGITLRQNGRYTNVEVRNISTWSRGLLADDRTISRNLSVINRDLRYFTLDNQVLASFDTGSVAHDLIAGVDYKNSREVVPNGLNAQAQAPDLDIYAPVYGKPFGDLIFDQDYTESSKQIGFYLQDQIRFENWRVTLSGRHDWTTTGYENRMSPTSSTTTDDRAFTGRIGLNYLFDNGVAPYASYSTSFEPVMGVTSPSRGSALFKPTEGRQFEAGVKYEPTAFDGLLSVAFFDLTQTNVQTTDPDNILHQVQTGEVKARGIELEARTNLTDALSLITSYSYTDTEVTKSNDESQIGRQLASIPRHQASLWTQYTFQNEALNGFTFGGGIRYVGSNYGDGANEWKTPGYALFDASLTIDLEKIWHKAKGTTFQLNATNLFDKDTVNVCFSANSCMLGQGRTILATLKHRW